MQPHSGGNGGAGPAQQGSGVSGEMGARVILRALEDLHQRLDDVDVVLGVVDMRTAKMAAKLGVVDPDDDDPDDEVEPPGWINRRRR
jgi:hypothetical protein